MFQITVVDSLSISQLALLSRNGESVVRAAHVGNQYSSNMTIMQAGLHTILYDRTLGSKDRNYHPHLVLRRGTPLFCEDLCDPDMLVSCTTAGEDHLKVLRRVFPDSLIELYDTYLQRCQENYIPILSILKEYKLLGGKKWSWSRFVDREGFVTNRKPKNWKQIEDEGIYRVTTKNHGWIIPNIFNVILMSLYESLKYKTNTIHHLSGPDMIKYINSIKPDMVDIWSTLKKFTLNSEVFDFRLYPTASARFVTLASRRRQLDQLISSYEKLLRHLSTKGVVIKGSSITERDECIKELVRVEGFLRDEVREAVHHCPELFADIRSGLHLTHYDVDFNGLYVPKWTMEQPLFRLAQIYKNLNKMYQQVEVAA